MFIDEEGKVVSCDGCCPEVIGRHWNYCGYVNDKKLYSYGGIYWYAFGRDEMVQVINDEVNAFPCSVWEMLYTRKLYDDVEFVKRFRRCIVLSDFIDAGIKEEYLLEGLLS